VIEASSSRRRERLGEALLDDLFESGWFDGLAVLVDLSSRGVAGSVVDAEVVAVRVADPRSVEYTFATPPTVRKFGRSYSSKTTPRSRSAAIVAARSCTSNAQTVFDAGVTVVRATSASWPEPARRKR